MHACVAILLRERAGISDGEDGWSVGEGRGWKSELNRNDVMVKARRSNGRVDSAAALSKFYFHPSVVKQHVNIDLTHRALNRWR